KFGGAANAASGSSIGAGGTIGTNVVVSGATATATGSSLAAPAGDVTVRATNTGTIAAHVVNAAIAVVESGATGSGTQASPTPPSATAAAVTLAFNSIGWDGQNVLFNTIDALIGDPLIAGAFGNEVGSGATAKVTNTVIGAGGAVTVEAVSEAQITSDIKNNAEADATGKKQTKATSLGAVVVLNKVSDKATSSVTSGSTAAGGAGVSVRATDDAGIHATTTLATE